MLSLIVVDISPSKLKSDIKIFVSDKNGKFNKGAKNKVSYSLSVY